MESRNLATLLQLLGHNLLTVHQRKTANSAAEDRHMGTLPKQGFL